MTHSQVLTEESLMKGLFTKMWAKLRDEEGLTMYANPYNPGPERVM